MGSRTRTIADLFPGDGKLTGEVARFLRHFALLLYNDYESLKREWLENPDQRPRGIFAWKDRSFADGEERPIEAVSGFLKDTDWGEKERELLRNRALTLLKAVVEYAPRAGGGGSSSGDETGAIRLESIAGFLLIAGAEDLKDMFPGGLELLAFLSRYRLLSKDATMWTAPDGETEGAEREGPPGPSKEEMLKLLELIQPVAQEAGGRPITAPSILSILGPLVEAIQRGPEPVLDSGAYRRLLWDSIDSVIWQEILERLYRRVLDKTDCPDRGSMKTMEAAFWLVSEMGHVALGVDRGLKIHERLRRALFHENTLYQQQSRYRDHLFHALRTFCLGRLLLTAKNGPFASGLPAEDGPQSKVLLRNWFIAALCHDFGYAMELCPPVLDHMEAFAWKGLRDVVGELKRTWDSRVQAMNQELKREQHLASDLGTRCNHGIASFFHLQRLLAEAGRGTDATEYGPALQAIFVHDLPNEAVDFKTEPIPAALIICDELQEWDRPSCDPQRLTESVASLINLDRAEVVRGRRIAEPIQLENCSVPGGRLEFAEGAVPKIVIRYADQNVNRFDPLSRILAKIYNLERIDAINEARLCIELWVRALTKKEDVAGGPRVREIDILRDFALLYEVSHFSPELYTLVHGGFPEDRRCVHWQHVDKQQDSLFDVLTLNLRRFPAKPRNDPLVGKDPSEFHEELREFKREYCRKKGVECRCYADDEPWEIKHIR